MGTKAPAVARLESAVASGKHSPSIDTLRKYAKSTRQAYRSTFGIEFSHDVY